MTTETESETVADVLADLYAMAAKCGGLQYETIHAMTQRIAAAHAREVGELRKDAARLDWIEESCGRLELDPMRLPDGTKQWRDPIGSSRDSIDAAMSPRVEVIR